MLSQPSRSSLPDIRVSASSDVSWLPPTSLQSATSTSKILQTQFPRIKWKYWHSWFHSVSPPGFRLDLVDVRAITRSSLEPSAFPDSASHKAARDHSYRIERTQISQNAAASITLSEVNSNQDVISKDSTSIPGIIYPPATTVGKSTNIVWQACMVKKAERQKLIGQKGCVIWITGLSGSGKSTLACALDHALLSRGKLSYILDGDNLRHGLNNNLGFSAEDRTENIRRVGEVAKLFVDAGIICIASLISPYRKDRDACRKLVDESEFIEVYMNFPLQLCEKRDPKGLYKLARAGKIKGFTGIDDPYEPPLKCEIVMEPIEGRCPTPAEMAEQLISYLEERCFFAPP